MTKEFTSSSVQDTINLGRKIGELLKSGDVVALDGDLGAGKTVITRGICEGMGLDPEYVCSPTFTIVNEYDLLADGDPAATPLYHFDTYRLSGADDFEAAGLDEYFYRGGVCVIEWSSVIEELLPPGTICVKITGNGDTREIEVNCDEDFGL